MSEPNIAIDPSGRSYRLIHLAVKVQEPPGFWYVACVPHVPLKECSACPGRPWPILRTDDPGNVTCPLCKQISESGAKEVA